VDNEGCADGRLDGNSEGRMLGTELDEGVIVGRRVGCVLVVSIDFLDLDVLLNFTPANTTITMQNIIATAMPMYPKFLALISLAYLLLVAWWCSFVLLLAREICLSVMLHLSSYIEAKEKMRFYLQ